MPVAAIQYKTSHGQLMKNIIYVFAHKYALFDVSFNQQFVIQ